MRQPGFYKAVIARDNLSYVVCVNENNEEFSIDVTQDQAKGIIRWATALGLLLNEVVPDLTKYQERAILWGWDNDSEAVNRNASQMKLNLPKELRIRAEGYYETRGEIECLCSLAAERIKEMEDALETIADWGMSQPAGMNISEERWNEQCIKQLQRWARQAKNGIPLQT